MFSSFTGSVYMLAFWVCLVSSETFHPVKHGSSLKIMNAADSTYLTSTEHAFRPDYGAYVGMVLTEGEFDGTPNQIWDTIRWPNTSANQFWLYPKGATLNEITALNLDNFPIPAKNLIEFLYEQHFNSTGKFLIKSTKLAKCIQSQGPSHRIRYVSCDIHDIAQQWRSEIVQDEDKGRSKTKFYCKFSSG